MKLLKLITKSNISSFDDYVYVDNDNIYTLNYNILLIKKKPKELQHLLGTYDKNLFINGIYKEKIEPSIKELSIEINFKTNLSEWKEEMSLNSDTIKEIERISKFRERKC